MEWGEREVARTPVTSLGHPQDVPGPGLAPVGPDSVLGNSVASRPAEPRRPRWLQTGQQRAAHRGPSCTSCATRGSQRPKRRLPRTDSEGVLPSLGESGAEKAAAASPPSGAASGGRGTDGASRTERSDSSLPFAAHTPSTSGWEASPPRLSPLEPTPFAPCPCCCPTEGFSFSALF